MLLVDEAVVQGHCMIQELMSELSDTVVYAGRVQVKGLQGDVQQVQCWQRVCACSSASSTAYLITAAVAAQQPMSLLSRKLSQADLILEISR